MTRHREWEEAQIDFWLRAGRPQTTMFDVPPKCPALADKLTGLFNWKHTYKVHEKHKGLSHGLFQKSYSLNLPRGNAPVGTATTNTQATTTTNSSLSSCAKKAILKKRQSVSARKGSVD